MDFKKIRRIVRVANDGSISKAAVSLHVTQSALTKSVAEIERELGFRLFHRSSKGVYPTDRGQLFLARVGRILRDADELAEEVRSNRRIEERRLRIGVYPPGLESVLVTPLLKIRKKHPDVIFDITADNVDRIAPLVKYRYIDVAVGSKIYFEESRDFECINVAISSAKGFVRRGHPLMKQEIVRPADVASLQFVGPATVEPIKSRLIELYDTYGVDSRVMINNVNNYQLVTQLIENSNAFGVVMSYFLTMPAMRNTFDIIPCHDLFPPLEIACVTCRDVDRKPIVDAFISATKTIS